MNLPPHLQRLIAAFSKLTETVDQSGVASANPDIAAALKEVREVAPGHHLFYDVGDQNVGRVCLLCGLAIPAGARLAHAEWHDLLEASGDGDGHTGASAVWCPLCGDCTCPRLEGGEWIEDGWVDPGTGITGIEAKERAYARRGECPLHVLGPHG